MNKKICLCALLAGLILVAALVGCAYEALSDTSNPSGWNGVTASQVSPKDKVKFRLKEDSECDACHALEVASTENELCLAGSEDHADVSCLDCHIKDSALDGAHRKLSADSKMGDSLKRTSVEDQTCLNSECHNYDDMLANLPEDAMLVDENGTTVNPHEIHEVGQSHGDILCADCHTTHKEGEALQSANDKCLSCHHANVYECGTCH